MKRIGFLLLLVLSANFVFAQKGEVTSTYFALKEGFLDDAYESINKAAEHAKTKDWYKTWWYYGRTHQELSTTDDVKFKKLCDNCADKAFDAYIKSILLNFQDEELRNLDLEKQADFMKFYGAVLNPNTSYENQEAIGDILYIRFPALANGFVNQGVASYQEEDFESALEKFEKSLTISSLTMKIDTQIYYFASLAAINAEQWDNAIAYNEMLKQLNYGKDDIAKVSIFQNLAKGYLNNADTAKFISTLEEGVVKYPESSYPLVIDLFNYYVDLGESAKALEYISMAIENNPSNPQFFVIRGTLYEETGKTDKAKTEYEKALELDPANFDANYSLGAYYYNYAADTLAWANDNIPPTEIAKYNEVKKAADGLFKKALPFLEKSREIKPEDLTVLSTLKTIYYRVGELEKSEEVDARIKELTD
jgi:tetratricopeptide (TPR) repeat protein